MFRLTMSIVYLGHCRSLAACWDTEPDLQIWYKKYKSLHIIIYVAIFSW